MKRCTLTCGVLRNLYYEIVYSFYTHNIYYIYNPPLAYNVMTT